MNFDPTEPKKYDPGLKELLPKACQWAASVAVTNCDPDTVKYE